VSHAEERKRQTRGAWPTLGVLALLLVFYLAALLGYANLLLSLTMLGSRRPPWTFIFTLAAIGAGARIALRTSSGGTDRHVGLVSRASGVAVHALLMVTAAATFGATIYPSIRPQFGGGAVLEGYVLLKPGVPQELRNMLGTEPLPFVDLDDRFLYVVACGRKGGSTKPALLTVPLEFIALTSYADTFFAVPDYIKTHAPCP